MNGGDTAFLQGFEKLCQDAQVPATRVAAQAELESLRSREDIVPLSMKLIEHASTSESLFIAGAALRVGVLKRWRSLAPGESSEIRMWIMRFIASHRNISTHVRRYILRIAATCFRRAYGAESEASSEKFISELAYASKSEDDYSAVTALECLDMCTEEFLAPSVREWSDASAVEIEMFRRYRPVFLGGSGLIVRIFRVAKDSLRNTLLTKGATTDLEQRIAPALLLLTRTLSPKLINRTPITSQLDDTDKQQKTNNLDNSSVLRLDASWSALVDQLYEVAQISFEVLAYIKKCTPNLAQDLADLADSARQVIIEISSVSRSSYSSAQNASATLQLILSSMENQRWCKSAERSESLAYAEVWRQLASAHGLEGLTVFGAQVFENFAEEACALFRTVAIRQVQVDQDQLFGVLDGVDLMLETWASFSYDTRASDPNIRQVLQPLCEKVFIEYVHLSMKSVHAERLPPGAGIGGIGDDLDEEDFGCEDLTVEEARSSSAATLARFSLERSSSILIQATQDLAERVFFRRSADTPLKVTIATLAQEDLFFLVQLIAAILADGNQGEDPTVPEALSTDMSTKTSDLTKTAGHALFSTLIRIATMETNLLEKKGAHCDEASPRIGRSILDALDRIAPTYLVPRNTADNIAFDSVGGEHFVVQARAYTLTKAMEAITRRGFEPELSEAAAKLLRTLTMGVKKYTDLRSPAVWNTLLTSSIQAYQSLPPNAVENLSSSLTSVLDDGIIAEKVVVQVTRALPQLMVKMAELPDVAERCIAAVTMMKGVAGCGNVGQASFRALLEALSDYDGSVLHIVTLWQPGRYDVARAALALADDLIRDRLGLVSEPDAAKLLGCAMNIVERHAGSILKHSRDVPQDECVRGVEAILAVFQTVTDERISANMAPQLFRGLSALLPIITEELIAYPAVKKGYFDFITSLSVQFPQHVIRLPLDMAAKVFASIRLELFAKNSRSERKGLEAVAALVKGAKMQNIDGRVSQEFSNMTTEILLGVAQGTGFTQNMDPASETILLLVCMRPDRIGNYFENFARKVANNDQQIYHVINKLKELAAHAAANHGSTNNQTDAKNKFKETLFEFSTCFRDVLLRA